MRIKFVLSMVCVVIGSANLLAGSLDNPDNPSGQMSHAYTSKEIVGRVVDKKKDGLIIAAVSIGGHLCGDEFYILVVNYPKEKTTYIGDAFVAKLNKTEKTFELKEGYKPIDVYDSN